MLEIEGELHVFDPKYRLDHNLPMALGEMHKYRDGIVRKVDGSRVVEEVYIVKPAPGRKIYTYMTMNIIRSIEWEFTARNREGLSKNWLIN